MKIETFIQQTIPGCFAAEAVIAEAICGDRRELQHVYPFIATHDHVYVCRRAGRLVGFAVPAAEGRYAGLKPDGTPWGGGLHGRPEDCFPDRFGQSYVVATYSRPKTAIGRLIAVEVH